ncbi:helix-turn-helix domain-containing protein [Streptomyces sp. MK37H]|nr:helix-turn-helix domain-containing protein [Streptomyces sp. MK37H]
MRTAFHGTIRPPREGEAPAAAALVMGAYLRALRLSRGVNGSDAAWAIGSSAATLSRLETGRLHRIADAIARTRR